MVTKTVAVLFLAAAGLRAQVIPLPGVVSTGPVPIYIQGVAPFVQFLRLSPGMEIQTVNGQPTVVNMITAPSPGPLKQAETLTLTISPSDPLTWCLPPGREPTTTATYLWELHSVTDPGSGYAVEFPVSTEIAPGPVPSMLNPGVTTASGNSPQYIPIACGGQPGVVFASGSLQTGESRLRVMLRVAF